MHSVNVHLSIARENRGLYALDCARGFMPASSVKIEEGFRTKVLKPRLTN